MSAWHETEPDDISLDQEAKEVKIYVTSDDLGAIYKTITFDQIRRINMAIGWNGLTDRGLKEILK